MKTVSVKQIQSWERKAIEKYGVPSLLLMENAGRSVAREVISCLKGKKRPRICIFCGGGNNAGDGFVVGRHLSNAETKVEIFLIGDPKRLKTDALSNYQILGRLKFPIHLVKTITPKIKAQLRSSQVIVDALFGVGLNREIKGVYKEVIDLINAAKKKVVAVDVPSGLDGTTGDIYGVCVKADVTVTFSFAKKGFFLKKGPRQVGRIIVADIGIPSGLIHGR